MGLGVCVCCHCLGMAASPHCFLAGLGSLSTKEQRGLTQPSLSKPNAHFPPPLTTQLPHKPTADVFRTFHSGSSAHEILKDQYIGDIDESVTTTAAASDPKSGFEAEYRTLGEDIRAEGLTRARCVALLYYFYCVAPPTFLSAVTCMP
jgi:hypothetical protein